MFGIGGKESKKIAFKLLIFSLS